MVESERSDRLFPLVALSGKLGFVFGMIFIIGLIAAAYSSADSAITALTTSFCIDVLKIDKKQEGKQQERTRKKVHIGVTLVVLFTILLAKAFKEQNVIGAVFTAANYTYGPLLGLFFFGILTKRKINDAFAWIICLIIPTVIYFMQQNEELLFGSYKFGFELLGINGVLCFFGLYLFSVKKDSNSQIPKIQAT